MRYIKAYNESSDVSPYLDVTEDIKIKIDNVFAEFIDSGCSSDTYEYNIYNPTVPGGILSAKTHIGYQININLNNMIDNRLGTPANIIQLLKQTNSYKDILEDLEVCLKRIKSDNFSIGHSIITDRDIKQELRIGDREYSRTINQYAFILKIMLYTI
jgi:hypothetical protein